MNLCPGCSIGAEPTTACRALSLKDFLPVSQDWGFVLQKLDGPNNQIIWSAPLFFEVPFLSLSVVSHDNTHVQQAPAVHLCCCVLCATLCILGHEPDVLSYHIGGPAARTSAGATSQGIPCRIMRKCGGALRADDWHDPGRHGWLVSASRIICHQCCVFQPWQSYVYIYIGQLHSRWPSAVVPALATGRQRSRNAWVLCLPALPPAQDKPSSECRQANTTVAAAVACCPRHGRHSRLLQLRSQIPRPQGGASRRSITAGWISSPRV